MFSGFNSELQIRGVFDRKSGEISAILNENICCDPTAELPCKGSSDEGSQPMFNKENEKSS